MGENDPGLLQEDIVRSHARDGALPPSPIHNAMKVSGAGITLHKPILAAPLLLEYLLTLVEFHKGELKAHR